MDFLLDRKRPALIAAALACALVALLWTACGASAAETMYWDNYGSGGLAEANVDGSGGGKLNVEGAEIAEPEGTALDVAGGRLFVASSGGGESGEISFARINGSGGGVLNTTGAPVDTPKGIAIDPATGIVYWANTEGGPHEEGSIGWARLDGSGGGELDTTGATVDEPYRMAIDVVHGRVYWANSGAAPETISFANADDTGGGGDLDLSGATQPEELHGLVVDPAANRIYWTNVETLEEFISFASLSGGGGGDLSTANGSWLDPYGLAFDPTIGRFYWGNYSNSEVAEGAIGFLDLNEAGGGIDIESAPVDGPQDPVIYKQPVAAGSPVVSGAGEAPAALTCSQGDWASFPGSFVYAEPTSYAYRWSRDGTAIQGAEGETLTAGAPGTYACAVTATNDQGSATQTSAGIAVAPKSRPQPRPAPTSGPIGLALAGKPKVKTKPGGTALFRVTVTNGGDLATAPAGLCGTLSRKAKRGLKTPNCESVGPIAGHTSATAMLRVKVKKTAKNGAYKLTLGLQGLTANTVNAKVIVKGAKKHHKHRTHRK